MDDQPQVNLRVVTTLVKLDTKMNNYEKAQKRLEKKQDEMDKRQDITDTCLAKTTERAENNGKKIGWIMGLISGLIIALSGAVIGYVQIKGGSP